MKTIGKIVGRKPNGCSGKKKPLGETEAGAPTEEEKGKKSWDFWGTETQWKRGNERKIGERHKI